MELYMQHVSSNLILFVVSLIYYFFTPKQMNAFFGYKTNLTIKNQDVWDFANRFFSKQLLKYASIGLISVVLLVFISNEISWQSTAIMILSLAVAVVSTEKKLTNTFDEEGVRKK